MFGEKMLVSFHAICFIIGRTFSLAGNRRGQAPVVQRLDNAILQINHYPVDSVVCFVNTYPLDRVIQPLNNRGQLEYNLSSYSSDGRGQT